MNFALSLVIDSINFFPVYSIRRYNIYFQIYDLKLLTRHNRIKLPVAAIKVAAIALIHFRLNMAHVSFIEQFKIAKSISQHLNTIIACYALFTTVDLRFSNGQGRREIALVVGAFRPRTMCATINQSIRVFAQNGT